MSISRLIDADSRIMTLNTNAGVVARRLSCHDATRPQKMSSWPPAVPGAALLAVVPDPRLLRFLDGDDNRRYNRDTGQHVGAQILFNLRRLALASRFELQAPARQRV